MDSKTAYELLCEVQQLNPDYIPPKKHSTFLILELTGTGHETIELRTSIVDPLMPDKGDAKSYLALQPQQRAMLEISNILQMIIPGISAVAEQGPRSKELWNHVEHNTQYLVNALHHLSLRSASLCLAEPEKSEIKIKFESK